jgi:hypothetical protein
MNKMADDIIIEGGTLSQSLLDQDLRNKEEEKLMNINGSNPTTFNNQ